MKHTDVYPVVMILLGCCAIEASQAPQPDDSQSSGSRDVPVRVMPRSQSRHQLRHYLPISPVLPPVGAGLTVHAVVGEHKEQQADTIRHDDSPELLSEYYELIDASNHDEEEVKKQAALNQELTPFAGQLGLHAVTKNAYQKFFESVFAEKFAEKQERESKHEIQMWKDVRKDLWQWYLRDLPKTYRMLRKYFPGEENKSICDLIILSLYGVRLHHTS